jgi:hypothetical protein
MKNMNRMAGSTGFDRKDYNPVPDDAYAGSEGGTLYHQKGYFPQAWRNIMVQMNFTF